MQLDFTEAERAILLQAPMQAIAAVTLADRADPVTFLKEVQAGINILADEMGRQDLPGNLLPALIEALRQLDAQDPVQGDALKLKKGFELLGYLQGLKTSAAGQDQAVAHFQEVAAILAAKATGLEADAYKRWLMDFAQKIAEAIREGGIFGIGSSRISEKEADVLDKLAKALGLRRL